MHTSTDISLDDLKQAVKNVVPAMTGILIRIACLSQGFDMPHARGRLVLQQI